MHTRRKYLKSAIFTHYRPWPWIGSFGILSCITHQHLPTYQVLFNSESFSWTDVQTEAADTENVFIRLTRTTEMSKCCCNFLLFFAIAINVRCHHDLLCAKWKRRYRSHWTIRHKVRNEQSHDSLTLWRTKAFLLTLRKVATLQSQLNSLTFPTFQVNIYGVSIHVSAVIHNERHVISHCNTHIFCQNYDNYVLYTKLYLVKNSFLCILCVKNNTTPPTNYSAVADNWRSAHTRHCLCGRSCGLLQRSAVWHVHCSHTPTTDGTECRRSPGRRNR